MQSISSIAFSKLLLIVLIALPTAVAAQNSPLADWDRLRPDGEEFEIRMPRNSTAQTSKEPYHKMILNMRLYMSAEPKGPVFAVASMSGIKANPALYSPMERLNSYVDAFKHLFPEKVRGKDATATLALVGESNINGHQGRDYRISVGELSGSLQVYATRRRFYAVVALNTKKDSMMQKQFLSSFALQESAAEVPTTAAAQSETPKEQPRTPHPVKPDTHAGAEGATDGDEENKVDPTKRGPISGGVLNGKATSLPKPEYPAEARAAKAAGTVVVQVVIDEYGNVISARAVSGHPLLQQVCVNAASQAKFSPTSLMGEPVKVSGVITYNFVLQ
ncbi:MAG: energy transducer TonB [bacterium]